MRKELVEAALHHNNPERMPLLYFNGDQSDSDILLVDIVNHHLPKGEYTVSEWGFVWDSRDGTMGQVTEPVIPSMEDLSNYRCPNPFDLKRYEVIKDFKARFGEGRYYIAAFGLSGFTIMTLLLGFTEVLEMLALEDKRINQLADMVFGFEEDVITQLPAYGYDGVAFFDDWGTQTNLIISPVLWRSFFLPRYKQQFDIAHKLGLTIYFHSCGHIEAIIDDLIDAGVDFLNLSQPNLYDLKQIGERYGERVCFVAPISYQTTSIQGTDEEIWKEAERIITYLGGFGKSVIGYLEEYESIGLSEHKYKICEKAFQVLGAYTCGNHQNG